MVPGMCSYFVMPVAFSAVAMRGASSPVRRMARIGAWAMASARSSKGTPLVEPPRMSTLGPLKAAMAAMVVCGVVDNESSTQVTSLRVATTCRRWGSVSMLRTPAWMMFLSPPTRSWVAAMAAAMLVRLCGPGSGMPLISSSRVSPR